MPTLYLVRHGRAAAGWDGHADPGLDPQGDEQAQAMARELAPRGPLPVIVSPMARTRETAAALARAWNVEPRIEPRVGEIPSPMQDLEARGQWLREIMLHRWSDLDQSLRRWREDALAALTALATDTVVVTHFVVINAVVGAAAGDDRVMVFHPDYCSVHTFRVEDGRLLLVQRGAARSTRVL